MRHSRLNEACVRINRNLVSDEVLQEVSDSARSLTNALHGVFVVLDDSGRVDNFVPSGVDSEQLRHFSNLRARMRYFRFHSTLSPKRMARSSQRQTKNPS